MLRLMSGLITLIDYEINLQIVGVPLNIVNYKRPVVILMKLESAFTSKNLVT